MCSGDSDHLKNALKPKPFWEKHKDLHAYNKSSLAPDIPDPQPPAPPPQSAKSPDPVVLNRRNRGGAGLAVPGSTLLTGSTGVDPATLNLGNTKLGGG